MKNKSKRKKIKQQKTSSFPREWIYINKKEIEPADFRCLYQKEEFMDVQIWKEAGVVEIELPCGKSMDFEWGDPDLGDVTGNHILDKYQAETLYYVTIVPESYEEARKAMESVVECLGGIFCGDNENFQPYIE